MSGLVVEKKIFSAIPDSEYDRSARFFVFHLRFASSRELPSYPTAIRIICVLSRERASQVGV
jgi:hypothetical protein